MLTVKQGDKYDTVWTVREEGGAPLDLTGATVRLIARNRNSGPITLAAAVTNAALGQVTHTLTGTLLVGTYKVEAEVTRGSEVRTAPTKTYENLQVITDLD